MSGLVEEVRLARRLSDGPAILAAAGVHKAAVAEELGVHRVTVHRWLTGARRPHGELLRRWVRLLDDLDEASRVAS